MAKIRGVDFEENLHNAMGLEFYNLSHRFGYQSPNWPYFEDVKIERIHYMAKSGVLSQRITTSMHNTTHIDAPAHVIQGTPFIDEVPLPHFFGSGIVVSIPKKKWEPITYDDMEKAAGKIVRPRDVVIVNTGWHHQYEDSGGLFLPLAGLRGVGRRLVRGEEGQGGRPRHPGQRPSARDRDRPAAQRSAASASRRRIQGMVRRPRLEGRLSRNGSRCIASCSRTASSASRMSAAISTRSPAGAAPSPSSPGTGIAATAASFAWSPSSIRRAIIASRAGRNSDDRPQIFRSEALRGAQPSRLFLAAAVRRRSRRLEGDDRRACRISCPAAARARTALRRRRSISSYRAS